MKVVFLRGQVATMVEKVVSSIQHALTLAIHFDRAVVVVVVVVIDES